MEYKILRQEQVAMYEDKTATSTLILIQAMITLVVGALFTLMLFFGKPVE